MKKAILLLLILVFVLAMSGVALALVPSNSNDVWDDPSTALVEESYNYNDPLNYTGGSGPHGDYLTGTNKCRDCHAVHRAKGSFVLLRGNNRVEACDYCHSSGGSVIQVEWADAGVSNGHHAGWDEADYAPDTTEEAAYVVPGGGFGCMDCHSPHGNPARTVASIEERAADGKGNALLLGRPNKAGTGANYSFCDDDTDMTDWCATCHFGNKGLYDNDGDGPKNIFDNITETFDAGYSHDCQTDGTSTPGEKYLTCDSMTTDNEYMKVEPDGTNNGPTCRECHASSASGGVWPHKSSGYVMLEDGTSTSDPMLDNVCTDCHKTDALP